jgi:thioester reductase-like protein
MTGMLLTGATGFVGGEALLRYIERAPNHHFFLMIRARDDEHLAVRAEKLLNAHFKDTKEAVRSRLTFFRGNLLKPGLAISEEDRAMLVEKVDHVVHCAASVDFGMGLEESRQFNLEGTRKVLELCEEIHRAGHFNRLDYVSTAPSTDRPRSWVTRARGRRATLTSSTGPCASTRAAGGT